jgi:hypothetical protein
LGHVKGRKTIESWHYLLPKVLLLFNFFIEFRAKQPLYGKDAALSNPIMKGFFATHVSLTCKQYSDLKKN